MTYTGFGVYQQQPPPPPPRSNRRPLWTVLGVVVVLAVAGAVTGVVLAARGEEQAAPASTTSTAPAPEWQVVEDEAAEIAYDLPPSWENSGGGVADRLRLTKTWVSRPFQCQGRNMIQAMVGSGGLANPDARGVATGAVRAVARAGYAIDQVEPDIADPVVSAETDDRLVLSVAVKPNAVSACFSPAATVTAVALRKGPKVCVLVLNVAEGGPHVAEGPSDEDVKRILESVRLL
ncbi:hypothetical protein [Actinosynnema sp. NPDC020468]|uniref:hypothetical protein n=1 Tax=Actinosynnema sp. NPDC020468 TaxID=3154488 RepID=UPI0034106A6B